MRGSRAMDRKKGIVVIASFFILLWGMKSIPGVNLYIRQVKQMHDPEWSPGRSSLFASVIAVKPAPRQSSADLRELRAAIEREAPKRAVPAVDAKIDPIWKAIPGYNGLEVDVRATYEMNKKRDWRNNSIVYAFREVEPAIGLEDLEPSPIYKGNPNKPMVSLMINVAWGNEHIPAILKVLRKENVHATFFLDGSWLRKNTETAKLIQADGHELSSHAYSHKNMSTLSDYAAMQEITKTEQLLKERLGVNNRLFAPPSGDFDMQTVRLAHSVGLQTVLWTLDTLDWKKPSAQWIVNKITRNVEPGSMILMHPTASSSEALEGMIKAIKNKGLSFGTVSELISTKRVGNVEQGH